MNYANIKYYDIANGEGVRVSLFVSGCSHRCQNCFNPETWNFEYGKPYTKLTEDEIIKALSHNHISGLTLLGGEPMEPVNQIELLNLAKKVKSIYPQKTIWCYTGFTFDELLNNSRARTKIIDEILSYIDILVDGRFEIDKKDITLRFKGSSNQRIIDVKESLKQNKIILSHYNEKR